jgi:hypothetical protein
MFRAVLKTVAFVVLFQIAAARPASAQIDLSGIWAPIMHEDQVERAPGPEIGDYLGLPINDAGRLRGESWDASILTMEEHTCKPHPSTYGFRGVGTFSGWSSGARSGWTAVRIRRIWSLTRGRAFRPASGMATCWS